MEFDKLRSVLNKFGFVFFLLFFNAQFFRWLNRDEKRANKMHWWEEKKNGKNKLSNASEIIARERNIIWICKEFRKCKVVAEKKHSRKELPMCVVYSVRTHLNQFFAKLSTIRFILPWLHSQHYHSESISITHIIIIFFLSDFSSTMCSRKRNGTTFAYIVYEAKDSVLLSSLTPPQPTEREREKKWTSLPFPPRRKKKKSIPTWQSMGWNISSLKVTFLQPCETKFSWFMPQKYKSFRVLYSYFLSLFLLLSIFLFLVNVCSVLFFFSYSSSCLFVSLVFEREVFAHTIVCWTSCFVYVCCALTNIVPNVCMTRAYSSCFDLTFPFLFFLLLLLFSFWSEYGFDVLRRHK